MESWSVRVDLSIHASNWCEFKWFGLIQRFSMNSRFSWHDRAQGISASSGTPQQLWAGCPTARLPPAMAQSKLCTHEMQKCRDAEMQRCRDAEMHQQRQGWRMGRSQAGVAGVNRARKKMQGNSAGCAQLHCHELLCKSEL